MSVALEAVSVLTGWGQGTDALPADAVRAAEGRAVIPLARPALAGDRFRRATRECLLGVAAVDALLRESGIDRDIIRGCSTAFFYVTAAAYGSSNQAFVVAEAMRQARAGAVSGGTYFPYTAPSTVAGEVAIEFELTGPYGILIGGAATTIDALWQATRLLADGRCQRALVLAVETFEECADLYARGRWLVRRPLVEAAACALLVPGDPARAVRRAPDTVGARDARARPRRRDVRLRAVDRAGARARRRGDRVGQSHGRVARPPRRTLLGIGATAPRRTATRRSLGGLWKPKKCSMSSRRFS